MSFIDSPHFLRRVLWADAVSCIATGGLQAAWPGQLSALLGLPTALVLATGVFLLVYAAAVLWIASRNPLPRGAIWLIVAGNFAWAAGCALLLAAGPVGPTALGIAYVIVQAATVVVLGELQWLALRKGRSYAAQ
jgi:hypothetical protein